MVYNSKKYKPVFNTPMKRQQELAIATKIMSLLNKNKYDNLNEFIAKNNNYQNFLQNNEMENVVKHFGNTLTQDDFKIILENLKNLAKAKQDFEKDNIKTTNIGDKEFNSFEGDNKTYFIDNSNSNKTIEEQMKDLQTTQNNFQTSSIKQNTENMFKELENNKKESLNLRYLNEIDASKLNFEEYELYQIAINYQLEKGEPIRIDLQRGILVDIKDNITKINKKNGEFSIISDTDSTQKANNVEEKSYQKQLKLMPAINYQNN